MKRFGSGALRRLIAAACIAACAAPRLGAQPSIVIGYLAADTADTRIREFDRGFRLGVGEARRVATLLRRELRLVEIAPSFDAGTIAEQISSTGVRALIIPVLHDTTAARLASWARPGGTAIVTSSAPGASLCAAVVFRTGPDPLRRAAALARELMEHDSAGSGARRVPAYEIHLWHPDLERFGARQLTDRYTAVYGSPMTSEAWEGWIAVKAVWESALRARDGDIAAELARGAFDGHKGAALRFSPVDRMLMQPLILVRRDTTPPGGKPRLVKELPWPALSAAAADSSLRASPCPP